jgi:hypothetical protein
MKSRRIVPIVCVQNHYNLAHRDDDALIEQLARAGIAYVPFFPLGGFTPLQSSVLSDVARRLRATSMQVTLALGRASAGQPRRGRPRTARRCHGRAERHRRPCQRRLNGGTSRAG